MKRVAQAMLEEVANDQGSLTTGGFLAEYEDGELNLLFAVDQYETRG